VALDGECILRLDCEGRSGHFVDGEMCGKCEAPCVECEGRSDVCIECGEDMLLEEGKCVE